ncbi:hypothetical protein K1719_040073 [Acacia pycnantha]|nr:hypothetical protein K1719_040073 [Acacia pycnantha]
MRRISVAETKFGEPWLVPPQSAAMAILSSPDPNRGLTVVNVSTRTFPQTLDWLHSYLLQCIEQGISSVSHEKRPQVAAT